MIPEKLLKGIEDMKEGRVGPRNTTLHQKLCILPKERQEKITKRSQELIDEELIQNEHYVSMYNSLEQNAKEVQAADDCGEYDDIKDFGDIPNTIPLTAVRNRFLQDDEFLVEYCYEILSDHFDKHDISVSKERLRNVFK